MGAAAAARARRHGPVAARARAGLARRSAARRSATTSSTARRPTPATWRSCIAHGTDEQKERWLRAAGARRDPQLLLDDRARARRARTRRGWRPRARRDGDDYVINGHKWFTTGGRRRGVRDRDGGDRPRRADRTCAPADHRADRHARLRARAQHLGHGRRRRRLRPATPRCATTTCACPRRTCSAHEGAGFADRAGAARARGASTTACAGSASASARSTLMCARAATRELAPGKPLGDAADRAGLDRREPRRDRRRAPDGAATPRGRSTPTGVTRRASEISLIKFYVAERAAAGARPRDPGARRARHDRRHAARAAGIATSARARIYDGPDEVHKMVVAQAHPRAATACASVSERRRRSIAPQAGARGRGARPRAPGAACAARSAGTARRRGRAVPARPLEPDLPRRAGERELVLRRPPFGAKVKTAHDMGREYRILVAAARRSIRRRRSRSRTARTRRCSARRST